MHVPLFFFFVYMPSGQIWQLKSLLHTSKWETSEILENKETHLSISVVESWYTSKISCLWYSRMWFSAIASNTLEVIFYKNVIRLLLLSCKKAALLNRPFGFECYKTFIYECVTSVVTADTCVDQQDITLRKCRRAGPFGISMLASTDIREERLDFLKIWMNVQNIDINVQQNF